MQPHPFQTEVVSDKHATLNDVLLLSGLEIIKLFELSMKFIMLISIKISRNLA